MPDACVFEVPPDFNGQTLAAILRRWAGGLSWSEARRLIADRRVRVNGTVCLDDARRLKVGETIELASRAGAPLPGERDVVVHYLDQDLIVVDKPAGVQTVRRPEERAWSEQRKGRQPTLEELVQRMLPELIQGRSARRRESGRLRRDDRDMPRVRPVHRLDRDTSGLMLFALTTKTQQALVQMFAAHEIQRTYLAVVHGRLEQPRTIETWLTRDRGDGLRGSIAAGETDPNACRAVTHVRPLEHLGDAYTVVECRLETGRTHQIRIHLSEIGHMLCGEKRYVRASPDAPSREDKSAAPRQALHSAELRLTHPTAGQRMRFSSPLPRDLAGWLNRLRAEAARRS